MTTEELKVVISAEMAKFVSAVNEVVSALKDLEKAVSGTSDEIDKETKKSEKSVKSLGEKINELGDSEGFQKLADGAKAGLAVMAGAVIAVGATLMSLGESTLDYRNEMAKLNSSFEASGLSADSAKGAYKELYSVIGETDQAVEASQQIALLAKSEEEVAKWAQLGAGVVATFGDALQPETFYEAANETAKLGEATGAYVQMLEGAGVNVDDFNKKLAACNTEAERNELILSTAEDVLGEAGEAYRKTAEDIINYRNAQERLNEANAKLGETMTPVNTAFANFKAKIAEEIAPVLQDFVDNNLPALEEKLNSIAEAVGKVLTFISDNWGFIAPIAGIITAIMVALSLLSIGIGVYNGVMAIAAVVSSPVLIALVAIAAAIALVIVYWDEIAAACKSAWEVTKEIVAEWKEKWDGFKDKIADGARDMRQSIEDFANKASQKFSEVKTNISNRVNEIKANAVSRLNEMKSTAVSTVSGMASSITGKFESIKSSISEKINGARSAVQTAIDKIKSIMNFSWSLPKLKMPTIKISGSFSLNPPSAPSFSISWNKLGGVFDKPTLFNYAGSLQGIGEDGAEAVVPLEKNTQWLDRIAERLQSNGTPIVIQVDGKVFAETAINTINANTKQTGRLNLIYT